MNSGTQGRSSSSKLTNYLQNQRQISSAQSQSKKNDFLSKEEEYKRLNDELEKKTAYLVFEAEQVLKANEKRLESDYLDKFSINDEKTNQILDLCKFKQDQSIEKLSYETKNDEMVIETEINLIPKGANEMSNEAQIRFLKAKLKVMQEEIEKYGSDLSKKEDENFKLAQRCKELEEERTKQLRITNSHQTQIEKFKKLNEEMQIKVNQSDNQIKVLKNENEQIKKDLKKSIQDTQQLELRLNRSLEEIEKLKLELSKQMSSKKDLNEQEKIKIDNLQNENKRLHKQKVELIQAFQKQLKLIEVLKKQKIHLEAARIFQFSEQEFINALEWNINTLEPNIETTKVVKENKRPPSGLIGKNNNKTNNASSNKKTNSISNLNKNNDTSDENINQMYENYQLSD